VDDDQIEHGQFEPVTIQVCEAGVGSVPAPLTARTWNVWLPGESVEYACGLVQAANAPPSIAHSNVAPPGVEVKLKLADVLSVLAGGAEVIVVSGTTSPLTVHVKVAGVASVPAAFTARTLNVCEPMASPVSDCGLVQVV
jgi:hypothetical protein